MANSAERRGQVSKGVMRESRGGRHAADGGAWTRLGANDGGLLIGEPFAPIADPRNGTIVIQGNSGPVFTGVPFEPNRDYFLVAHVRRLPGNDLVTLFVNPTPGTEPTSGGFTYDQTDLGGGAPQFDLEVVAPSSITSSFDELRVGTTYADVAPVVPEPIPSIPCLIALSTLALRRGSASTIRNGAPRSR